MKIMERVWTRVLLLTTFTLSMSLFSYADEIQIPFPVYMDEFKAECKKQGLDLYGNRDSKGFVQDKASNFSVFTYHTATPDELTVIQEATWKTFRK